ncbi:hypothetical protein BGZ49_007338 [Haplosporangium sp. Z 27]|nr:hypothetical protein BGZ49_007338 [Haplosporangium sp. Z 27]
MTALLDPRYFPTFDKLPGDYVVNFNYFRILGPFMIPKYHWCFMAEIVDDTLARSPFLRHRLLVKDREGRQVPVLFYLPFLNTLNLKNGNTIFVRYARQHLFLDMSEGLRVEDSDYIHAVPLSLSTICDAHRGIVPNICKKCGGRTTKRCAKCKKIYYCSRECQTENWLEHRHTCHTLALTAPATALDHSCFTGCKSF